MVNFSIALISVINFLIAR